MHRDNNNTPSEEALNRMLGMIGAQEQTAPISVLPEVRAHDITLQWQRARRHNVR